MSGIGPMFGQANVFNRYAPEQIPFAQERYTNECLRLCGVLDSVLANSKYIAGDEITIADFATYPWVAIYEWGKLPLTEEKFPQLFRWLKLVGEREGVKRGMAVPTPPAKPPSMEEILKSVRNNLVSASDIKTSTASSTNSNNTQ